VRIVDDAGHPVSPGQVGRTFVGNPGLRGLHRRPREGIPRWALSIGDVGHFDDDGRLFANRRDDDMIISGGENVYPAEIEELLVRHSDITGPRAPAWTTPSLGSA